MSSAAQAPLHALLLLPPAPSPGTYETLKAAYQPCLLQVLRELAKSAARIQGPAILDIALPCPHLYGQLDSPRGPLYAATQSLVAALYKLVCIIAAKESIDTEDAQGVDTRIVLVAYPRDRMLLQPGEDASQEQDIQGPAMHLQALARSGRGWDPVYSVQSEEGDGVLQSFLSLSPTDVKISKLQGGTPMAPTSADVPQLNNITARNHLSVAVGGTFDHLHIGHKLLLTMFAFVLGRKAPSSEGQVPRTLTIGITGDELLKNKKYAEFLQSWRQRQQTVHEFLSSFVYLGSSKDPRIQVEEKREPGPNGHAVHATFPNHLLVKYVEISDPFGPTITDENISALVISQETRSGGRAVNDKRSEKGWSQLEVFEVDVLDAGEEETADETFQSKLSSTEIRKRKWERSSKAHA